MQMKKKNEKAGACDRIPFHKIPCAGSHYLMNGSNEMVLSE